MYLKPPEAILLKRSLLNVIYILLFFMLNMANLIESLTNMASWMGFILPMGLFQQVLYTRQKWQAKKCAVCTNYRHDRFRWD